MSFNAIRENKILAKIYEFTVTYSSDTLCIFNTINVVVLSGQLALEPESSYDFDSSF